MENTKENIHIHIDKGLKRKNYEGFQEAYQIQYSLLGEKTIKMN